MNPRERYSPPSPEELTPEQREVVAHLLGGERAKEMRTVPLADAEGRPVGVFALMPIAPAVGDRVQQVGEALRFRGVLSALERELCILLVARDRQSDFEWFAHERAALAAGAKPEWLQDIAAARIPSALPQKLRAVLEVLAELQDTDDLSDERYARAGVEFGAEKLAEIVWLSGYYRMLATALRVFRPPLPEGAVGVIERRSAVRADQGTKE